MLNCPLVALLDRLSFEDVYCQRTAMAHLPRNRRNILEFLVCMCYLGWGLTGQNWVSVWTRCFWRREQHRYTWSGVPHWEVGACKFSYRGDGFHPQHDSPGMKGQSDVRTGVFWPRGLRIEEHPSLAHFKVFVLFCLNFDFADFRVIWFSCITLFHH